MLCHSREVGLLRGGRGAGWSYSFSVYIREVGQREKEKIRPASPMYEIS